MSEHSYVVATNRQAYHDYFVDETVEAGIILTGTEVKSIREGKVNLRGAYARIKDGEVWLENVHIAEYQQGTYIESRRCEIRKLLLIAVRLIASYCGLRPRERPWYLSSCTSRTIT